MNIPFGTISLAKGEDRSSFQGVYRWKGQDFGFVKATEGLGLIDAAFSQNWANLKAEGKPRGAYHFFHPGQDAEAQARFFYDTVNAAGLEPGDMLVIDSEILAGGALRLSTEQLQSRNIRMAMNATVEDLSLTADQVDAATLKFLYEVRRLAGHEHPVMTYTMHQVGQYLVRTAEHFPLLWFAWPSLTSMPPAELLAPWKKWTFWQYSWNGVDQDLYDGTAGDLDAFLDRHEPKPYHPKVGPVQPRWLRRWLRQLFRKWFGGK